MAENNEGQVVVKNERKYYLDNIRVLIILDCLLRILVKCITCRMDSILKVLNL